MAQKTDAELLAQSDEIKDETVANANTATRIGQMHEDVIDSKINHDTALSFRGTFSGTSAFPSTGGRGASGAPAAFDIWILTNTLTVSGNVYAPGTIIMALTDTPGNTLSNWAKFAMQL